MGDRFLRAQGDDGTLYACIAEGSRFTASEVGATRLAAALRPYRDEEAARAALIAAGGRGAEWEGKR